ncbi:MAG: hypothetical protein P4L73_05215 [Caulobacteraceae bacterium]|nr:hypothetical protein [Caulobacteraceae bacterium]
MICLALSLVAAAITAVSVSTLALARKDYERDQAATALAGGQTRAALVAASTRTVGRLRWLIATDAGPMDVLAEPEAAKLGPGAASGLDQAIFPKLGVSDTQGLRQRLEAMADGKIQDLWVGELDPSPAWRACAPSVVSAFGLDSALKPLSAQAPGPATGGWRGGQVWRIRVVESHGWVDDRLVRLTGNPAHPAAVIERLLTKGEGTEQRCDALFGAS